MQIHVALRQCGWSRRTRGMSSLWFLHRYTAPVFRLRRDGFLVFPPRRGDTLNRLGVNFAWRSRLKTLPNFTKISPHKRPSGAYPLGDFTKFSPFVGSFMFGHIGGFAHGISKLWWFKYMGVRVTPNFQFPLAAKLCVGCEGMQEWYGPPLSPCQVWWSLDFARRRGQKKNSMFLFSFFYRQHCAQRIAPVFRLLRGRF